MVMEARALSTSSSLAMPLRFLCYLDEIKLIQMYSLQDEDLRQNADSITQNVFDGTKDLCGLQLQGIEKQASVGFLSYLECLRYLEVGIGHRPNTG